MSFEILFAWCNQGYIIYHTRDISKKFKITSKYFSIFNGTPPANWFSHIARDFLTYYTWLFIVLWFHCSQFKNDQDLIFTSKTKHRKNSENVRNSVCCFTLNLYLQFCLEQGKLSWEMTTENRNDWRQIPWVVPRKICFRKLAKSLKLVKEFRFQEKEDITYGFEQPRLQDMLSLWHYRIFLVV